MLCPFHVSCEEAHYATLSHYGWAKLQVLVLYSTNEVNYFEHI